MKSWPKIRLYLLRVIFFSLVLALAKSIFLPAAPRLQVAPLAFPAAINLTGWQSLGSYPLDAPTAEDLEYINGRRYRYRQNNLGLDIEMRYLANTSGSIREFIDRYTAIYSASGQAVTPVYQNEKTGFYTAFIESDLAADAPSDRAYLSACINPQGGSTVTDDQFRRNRNLYDWRSPRFFLWLLGQAELKDNRCLWAHLSIQLGQLNRHQAIQVLELAWLDLSAQWQRGGKGGVRAGF